MRPATAWKRGPEIRLNPSYAQGYGVQLKTLLSYAYSIPGTRLEGTWDLLDTRYDFCVLLPPGMTGEAMLLRDALERSFKLRMRRERREVDALVLRSINPKLRELKGLQIGPTVKGFAGNLEWRLKRYVVDETGLEGFYEIDQPAEGDDIELFVRRLGFQLIPSKRTIEIMVLESLELPSFR